MVDQPAGTVTLVFTDIEGSTRLLGELGQQAYREVLGEHRRVVREAFGRHDGYEVDYEGDSFFYAFASAPAAVQAVGEAMEALTPGPIRIRVGVHTGEPGLDPPKYVGLDIHRAARVMAAAHGGQVLLSTRTRSLLDGSAPICDLGEHRLKDFPAPERLFQLGEGDFPPLRTLMTTTLPVPATAFLGREEEVATLAALLEGGSRLVTLTGPGGIGKTRLALRSATAVAQSFPDGLWWVSLAPLRDPSLLASTVGQALHVTEEPGREIADTVVERVMGKRMLLVLDNFEQLLPTGAATVARLRDAGGPSLLVTSRERLRLSGEQIYRVPELTREDAVELFVHRARMLDGAFTSTPAVGEVCARLDDLPLAIELAAARTPVFSPVGLLERLRPGLDLLRGDRDSEPRQETLRSTIEWSYDLLDEGERRLFLSLSVFLGGCSLEAAERVCAATFVRLESLIEKSLLRRQGDRYWMLETIRELAFEKLEASGAGNEHRARLAEFLLALANEADLEGPDQVAWLERLEQDHDNFRAALAWAHASGEEGLELALASKLGRFWLMRGYQSEGRERLGQALAADREPNLSRVEALHIAGFIASRQGRPAEAEGQLMEGVELAAALGDETTELRLRSTLAGVVAVAGDVAGARAMIERDLPAARRLGGDVLGSALVNLSDLALIEGDATQSRELAEEAVEVCRQTGNLRARALALGNLGMASLSLGMWSEARRRTAESLELFERLGEEDGAGRCMSTLGAIAAMDGEPEKGCLLLARGEATLDSLGTAMDGAEGALHARVVSSLRAILGPGRFEAIWADGAALSWAEAVELALGT